MLCTIIHPPSAPKMHPGLAISMGVCGAIVLGALVFLTAKWILSPPEPTDTVGYQLSFPELIVDSARLVRERQHVRTSEPEGLLESPEVQQLHELVKLANTMQFPSREPILPSLSGGIDQQIRLAANEVVLNFGAEHFIGSGTPIFLDCETNLAQLLGDIKQKSVSFEQAISDPPKERHDGYMQNCGNALAMLHQHGLVNEDGQWSSGYARHVFGILQRVRWSYLIHTHHSMKSQLTDYEYEIFMRWRIEDPDAYSLEDRRRFVATARSTLPHYDADFAKIVLDSHSQHTNETLMQLERLAAQNQNAKKYDKIVEKLREQIQSSH